MKKIIYTLLSAAIIGLSLGYSAGAIISRPANLALKPAHGRELSAYQLQGGNRQTVQLTASNDETLQRATIITQGDQEDSDNSQTAMGYNALGWTLVQ